MTRELLWAWSPADWERIEQVARQFRADRALLQGGELIGGAGLLSAAAGMRSSALELGQWAALACVRELHHHVEIARRVTA